MLIILLIKLIFICATCDADNFLIVHGFYSGSHVLTLHTAAESLIATGLHSVTTIRFAEARNVVLKPLGPNHTDVVVYLDNEDGRLPYVTQEKSGKFDSPLELMWSYGLKYSGILHSPVNPWLYSEASCDTLLGNSTFINGLRNASFDVIIVDVLNNECGLALAKYLNAPIVAFWAFSCNGMACDHLAMSTLPSYIPGFMTHLVENMSFLQRVINFLSVVFFLRPLYVLHLWVLDGQIRKHVPDFPPTSSILSEINGALIVTDEVFDFAKMKASTFINVGGLQIKENHPSLSKDLKDWIEGAQHGVILVSMGFIFKLDRIPKDRINEILNALSRLPQRIIFRMDKTPSNPPDNIFFAPFLPQQAILAHPQTRLFFTHCGMNSALEAIYYAVPMVGMPIFMDQGDVATKINDKGIGLVIDKASFTSDELYNTIVTVRDDSKYSINIKKLSTLFKLRRHRPMEDAIWLLEYISKTKGAKHHLPESQKFTFLKYHSIDIILVIPVLYLIIKGISKFSKK